MSNVSTVAGEKRYTMASKISPKISYKTIQENTTLFDHVEKDEEQ